jgi:putative ABC transport system substrate-binding protein
MPRDAVLLPYAESDPLAQTWFMGFVQGMRALGWNDGRNLRTEVRWTGGVVDRLQPPAKELVGQQPDVVLAVTTPAVNAVMRETRTTPIVFMQVTEPVAQGLVASLSRPGGNITGITLFEPEMGGKWLQVLKEIAPATNRAAILFNPDTAPYYRLFMRSIEAAAASLNVRALEAPVRSLAEIGAAIASLAREEGGGLIAMADGFTTIHRDMIIALAAQYRLPAVYNGRPFVLDGGLVSYGGAGDDMQRRAANFVDRILKGTKPADLPVELPTKFELVINLKTAKALGVDIPLTLLTRADAVIE